MKARGVRRRLTESRLVTYLRGHGLVNRTPPDVLLRAGLLDNTLVKGRAASLGAGVGGQGTAGGDGGASLVNQSILVKSSNGGVGNLW